MSRFSRRVNSGVVIGSNDIKSSSNALSQEFTVDHIYDIRSAVVCLLDAIASMVESQNYVPPESYFNLAQQMFYLDEDLFKGIHDRYLWWSSGFLSPKTSVNSASFRLVRSAKPPIQTTSHHGFAIKYSRVEADRFLQSLLVGFETCKAVLFQSLKRKSEKETKLYHQVLSLKDDLQKHESDLKLSNTKLDEARREKTSWIEKIDDLTQKLETAEERISKLENMGDVLRWQRLLDNATSKHILSVDDIREKHEAKLKQMQKTEDNLRIRIKKLEAEIGKLKLRNEVPISQSSNFMLEKLDHVRQQLYLRDQTIHVLRKDMLEQQRQMAGWLHGLQEDFKSLLDKVTHDNPGRAFSPDKDNLQFQAKLRLLHDSCVEGKLREATANLSQQYQPSKLTCALPVKKTKSSSHHTTTTESLSTVNNFSAKSNSISVNPLFSVSTPRKRFIPIQPLTPQTYSVSRATIATMNTAQLKVNGENADEKKEKTHPQLVSPITGRANLVAIMKHFPYLTVEQVTQQWENFRKYDKNKDFNLDLPELYEVITDVCGLKVTVSEMKEAMAEVDRDRTNSVDFYEYLKIAEMIIKKQGNAAIFRSDKLQGSGVTMSKACVIQ